MKFVFRPIDRSASPEEGTLRLAPRHAADASRRDFAMLALEKGLDGFASGGGTITQIVLPKEPTLDDMLAAELLSLLANGDALPPGIRPFAIYSHMARQGLRPDIEPRWWESKRDPNLTTQVPMRGECLSESLEGIYQAIRNGGPKDLVDPDNAARFFSGWRRIAERVLKSANEQRNPLCTPLFDDAEFALERSYLRRDQEVYRQDVARGEQWWVRLPDGPPEAWALILKDPKSLFFNQWSRNDAETLDRAPYLFLGVRWGPGDWDFSTDPVHRLSLKSLYEGLQEAELTKNQERGISNPWFDGAPFNHTIIGAPKGGSALSDQEIVRIVKTWCQAVPLRKRGFVSALYRNAPSVRIAATAVLALCLIVAVGMGALRGWRGLSNMSFQRQLNRLASDVQPEPPAPIGPRVDHAILFATDHYDESCWSRLDNPIFDATKLATILENTYGFRTKVIKDPTWSQFCDELTVWQGKEFGPHDQIFVFIAGHGDFNPASKLGYVTLKDSTDPRQDSNHLRYVTHAELRERVNSIRCNHVFVALDVCFGGTFDFDTAMGKPRGFYQPTSKDEFVDRQLRIKCRRYLTSGGRKIVSDGVPGKHSPFAARLIDALEGKAGDDGILTLAEILLEVKWANSQPCYGQLRDDDIEGDFLFVKKELKIQLAPSE